MKSLFKHYFMCEDCALEMGGEWPPGDNCITVSRGTCEYCDKEDVTLIPWVDFNWPKDKESDRTAKAIRD